MQDAQMENGGVYFIENMPNRRFNVATFVEPGTALEMFLLNNGFDGYCYAMREVIAAPTTQAEVIHCYKKIDGDFVVMK